MGKILTWDLVEEKVEFLHVVGESSRQFDDVLYY